MIGITRAITVAKKLYFSVDGKDEASVVLLLSDIVCFNDIIKENKEFLSTSPKAHCLRVSLHTVVPQKVG